MAVLNANETQIYNTLLDLIKHLAPGTQFAVRDLIPCTHSRVSIKLLQDISSGKVTTIKKLKKTRVSWEYERI